MPGRKHTAQPAPATAVRAPDELDRPLLPTEPRAHAEPVGTTEPRAQVELVGATQPGASDRAPAEPVGATQPEASDRAPANVPATSDAPARAHTWAEAAAPSTEPATNPESAREGEPAEAADSGGRLEASEGEDRESSIGGRAASLAEAAASAASDAAGTVAATLSSVVRGAGQLAGDARRVIDDRPAARRRRLRDLGRQTLPVLWDEHPGADRATRRDLGIQQVPVDKIRGTAVAGAQRGGDFLPIEPLRGSNWQGRWRRIVSAMDRLQTLPPLDLIKTGGEFWVVDGHNRVGAALYHGQVAVDANVVELQLPGSPRSELPPGPIGAYLADEMRQLRAAGEGRFSPQAGSAQILEPIVSDAGEPSPEAPTPGEAVRRPGSDVGSDPAPEGEQPDVPATGR